MVQQMPKRVRLKVTIRLKESAAKLQPTPVDLHFLMRSLITAGIVKHSRIAHRETYTGDHVWTLDYKHIIRGRLQ